MPKQLEQKRAANLSADFGYSRFTCEDEQGKHRTLSSYLDPFTPAVESYGVTLVHSAEDALLADYSISIDALICAVQLRRAVRTRVRNPPDTRKLKFRIGDVMGNRDDINVDDINVAAHAETLVGPSGIWQLRDGSES